MQDTAGEAGTSSEVTYSNGPPHMAKQKQDDQLEHTYSIYVRIRDVALKTCQRRWMIGRSGERGSRISLLAAWHNDDDIYVQLRNKKINEYILLIFVFLHDILAWHKFIYIYIYMYVCRQTNIYYKIFIEHTICLIPFKYTFRINWYDIIYIYIYIYIYRERERDKERTIERKKEIWWNWYIWR